MPGKRPDLGTSVPAVIPVACPPRQTSTLCIITCHNYGRYLRQCIESCQRQSVPFTRIIVVDDASTDDTAGVTAACGVEYLRVDCRDVAQARNAGVRFADQWSDFLLFVDADNWLPANFHELLLKGMMDNQTGVTYSHIRRVDPTGKMDGRSPYVRPFDPRLLERTNFADTCSLVRREAFEQVDGWWGERSGLEDWFLWMKIVRGGWQMRLVPEAEFFYRVHPEQMSINTPNRREHILRCIEMGQQVVIVGIFGGRSVLEPYFNFLAGVEWERSNLHLVAIDNSAPGSEEFSRELKERLAGCGLSYTYAREPRQAVDGITAAALSDTPDFRREHHFAMHLHMCRLYALARNLMPSGAALIWTVEDDVEPPKETLRELVRAMVANGRLGMVAALVPNRFTPGYIAWTGPSMHQRRRIQERDTVESLPVLATTFACTLFRREVWELTFRPVWCWGDSGSEAAFDWAAGEDTRRAGWQISLVPIRCKHAGRMDSGWAGTGPAGPSQPSCAPGATHQAKATARHAKRRPMAQTVEKMAQTG